METERSVSPMPLIRRRRSGSTCSSCRNGGALAWPWAHALARLAPPSARESTRQLFSRGPSAINHQCASGYHRALVRGKVESRRGDFLGFCHSPVQLRRSHLLIGGFWIGVL